MKYQCWGDDKEDLTEKVKEAIQSGGVDVFRLSSISKTNKEPLKWRVHVTCSKGDVNIFEGETSFGPIAPPDAVCGVKID